MLQNTKKLVQITTEQGGRENRHSFPFFFSLALPNNLSKKRKAFCVQATSEKRFRYISLMEENLLCAISYLKYCVQFLVYINKSSLYDLSSIVHTENIKIRPRAKRPGRFSTIKHVFILFRRFNRHLYLLWDVQKTRIVFQETLPRCAMTLASHISSRKSF